MKIKGLTSLGLAAFAMATSILFSGCGGEDETTGDADYEILSAYRVVESDDFLIQVPEDWETLQDFPSSYPDNTIVAFKNNVKNEEFIANINIVLNTVDEGTSTSDYALDMYQTVSDQLLNFKKTDQEEVQISINNEMVDTFIFEFEGTNNATEPERGFIQTYAVLGTDAYIITGAYALDDTELAIDQIKQSIPTFMVK